MQYLFPWNITGNSRKTLKSQIDTCLHFFYQLVPISGCEFPIEMTSKPCYQNVWDWNENQWTVHHGVTFWPLLPYFISQEYKSWKSQLRVYQVRPSSSTSQPRRRLTCIQTSKVRNKIPRWLSGGVFPHCEYSKRADTTRYFFGEKDTEKEMSHERKPWPGSPILLPCSDTLWSNT